MKRQIRELLVSASLATLALAPLGVPIPAAAASADRIYRITTRMVEQSPSVGEFDGSLSLHVSADGIVSGYYRPDDNTRFISVTGGITGDRFWLEIGSFSKRPMRFTGTFRDGKIDASSSGPFLDDGHFTGLDLTGTPKAG